MNPLKQLAGQTAIYGLSSIVGRFLNYLLVPLHTAVFQPAEFGVVTELYAYVAFFVVLLNYGMETAFFRFSTQEGNNPDQVFSTGFTSLVVTSCLFMLLVVGFSGPIASAMAYAAHPEYIIYFGLVLGFDAISTLPMARLRAQNKALRFTLINLITIGVNVGLNVLFLNFCLDADSLGSWASFCSVEAGVGYIFLANVLASAARLILLSPAFLELGKGFNFALLRSMNIYAFPLLFAGLGGIVNETLDRALLKWILLPEYGKDYALEQMGIYGANYKLAIIISLFIQAYRYAAEPFFFNKEGQSDSKELFARIMNVFVGVVGAMFLFVLLYLDIFKYFTPNKAFWPGLQAVPILLGAYIFLGIYYNQSAWYKLSGKTKYGAYITLLGAAITILLNIWLIPILGYMGSAWATLACYFSMSVISWILGQKHYPIPYNVPRIGLYLILALGFYGVTVWLSLSDPVVKYSVHTAIMLLYLAIVVKLESSSIRSAGVSDL